MAQRKAPSLTKLLAAAGGNVDRVKEALGGGKSKGRKPKPTSNGGRARGHRGTGANGGGGVTGPATKRRRRANNGHGAARANGAPAVPRAPRAWHDLCDHCGKGGGLLCCARHKTTLCMIALAFARTASGPGSSFRC